MSRILYYTIEHSNLHIIFLILYMILVVRNVYGFANKSRKPFLSKQVATKLLIPERNWLF